MTFVLANAMPFGSGDVASSKKTMFTAALKYVAVIESITSMVVGVVVFLFCFSSKC